MSVAVLLAHKPGRYEVEAEVKHIPPRLARGTFARSRK